MTQPSADSSREELLKRERSLALRIKEVRHPQGDSFSVVGAMLGAALPGGDLLSVLSGLRGEMASTRPQEIDSKAAAATAMKAERVDIMRQPAPTNNTLVVRHLDMNERTALAGMSLSSPSRGMKVSPTHVANDLSGPAFKNLLEEQKKVDQHLSHYAKISTAADKRRLERDARTGDHAARQIIDVANRS